MQTNSNPGQIENFKLSAASGCVGPGAVAWATLSLVLTVHAGAAPAPERAAAKLSAPIAWSELGAKAGADYKGNGLAVTPTESGARLRCVFQRLEGEATTEGLWLSSTVTNGTSERFRVVASSVGRAENFGARRQSATATPFSSRQQIIGNAAEDVGPESGVALRFPPQSKTLPCTGIVEVADKLVRFVRPGLTEEYSVSMDGVRQDFLVMERPSGEESLRVGLAVSGARVEPTAHGTQLVLENSGRKITYSRLRVTDANGKELPARLEVLPVAAEVTRPIPSERSSEVAGNLRDKTIQGVLTSAPTGARLAAVVDDAGAVYPVRIDPTFSDADWRSFGTPGGPDGPIEAAVVDNSGNLYVGGHFVTMDNLIVNHVAKWDGSAWSTLGQGVDGPVRALAVSGTNLYVGGAFAAATNTGGLGVSAYRIARWDGGEWWALGAGIGERQRYGAYSEVFALAVSGGELYVGGGFSVAGDHPAANVAKWNGNDWQALAGGVNYDVLALAISGNEVYAGGGFTMATNTGGVMVNARCIARWNGSAWSPLGGGLNSIVYALAASGPDLFAGGSFGFATNTGGASVAASGVARWSAGNWSALAGRLGNIVKNLAVAGTNLIVAGSYFYATNADGVPIGAGIARWNGNSWSELSPGGASEITALAVSGPDVYMAGSGARTPVARWNETSASWMPLGDAMNGWVRAIVLLETNLYVGGEFSRVGDVFATSIARWDGDSWSALASGIEGKVHALAMRDTNLFAGGSFRRAGGARANNIARWDGGQWWPLGEGLNDEVFALAVSGNELTAGGKFTRAGRLNADGVAKWNGSTWAALAGGVNGEVHALAVSGNDIYAGGNFTTATNLVGETVTVNHIARWNGAAWSALGGGLNSAVQALAVSGSDLYAGGWFNTAINANGTEVTVNHIARWNGSAWAALGPGLPSDAVQALAISRNILYASSSDFSASRGRYANLFEWDGRQWRNWYANAGPAVDGAIHSLATSGNGVYAGGDFSTPAAKAIALWDGRDWSSVNAGVNGGVQALALMGTNLYVGGDFTQVGGFGASHIAKWDGNRWSALGEGPVSRVSALAVGGATLYASGGIWLPDGRFAGVASWDGVAWTGLGHGMTNLGDFSPYQVAALAASDSGVYAGGLFSQGNGWSGEIYWGHQIFRWDGSAWVELGAGIGVESGVISSPAVSALALSGNDLYAGGVFTIVTNLNGTVVRVNRIARWNGSTWSALGQGLDGQVRALAVSGNNLYVAGDFLQATNANGEAVYVHQIARWNGNEWSALGALYAGTVRALAVSGTNLYAGGDFRSVPDALASGVAKWDGVAWSSLGSGIGGAYPSVHALALTDHSLYLGGEFGLAGGRPCTHLVEALFSNAPSAPVITAPPQGQTTFLGSYVTFTVAATGTAPLSYHWLRNGNAFGASNAPSITLPAWPEDAGSYSVIVSNAQGSVTSAPAVLTVERVLAEALDLPNPWMWTVEDLISSWFHQTRVTYDGVDAAQCGLLNHGQQSTLNLPVEGPARLVFWWKVSSQTNSDFLELLLDGVAQPGRISGEVEWAQAEFAIPAGAHEATWRYQKDSSGHAGEDRAWVDQVRLIPSSGPPVIVSSAEDQVVAQGDNAKFEVVAGGAEPLFYQWYRSTTKLEQATNRTLWITNVDWIDSASFSVVVSNEFGVVENFANLWVVWNGSLEDALDTAAENFWWDTGGGAPWSSQSRVTHDGQDAAQSGRISHGEETWMSAYVGFPSRLSFWWKVSSETNHDFLELYLDDVLQPDRISGEVDWTRVTLDLPPLTSWVKWRYVKDGSGDRGQDRGWVDQVSLEYNGIPDITNYPSSQTVSVGETATFSVGARGATPLYYQWFKGNSVLLGATNSSLVLVNVTTNDAGNYSVGVSNPLGSVGIGPVVLTVTVPTVRPQPVILVNDGGFGVSNGAFAFNLTGQSGQVVVVQSSTNLSASSWQGIWTNTFGSGPVRFSTPLSDTNQGRFYRLWLP